MNSDCGMTNCEMPAYQAWLCPGHTARLSEDFRKAPGLFGDLEVTRHRLARIGAPGRGSSSDRPPPWHERAAVAADELAEVVLATARQVADTRGQTIPERPRVLAGPRCGHGWCDHDTCRRIRDGEPASIAAVAAGWLAGHVDWLRHHPSGPGTAERLNAAVRAAERVVDRQADRWYAGPCWAPLIDDGPEDDAPAAREPNAETWCMAELYANPGATYVRCRGCGTTFDVTERRKWLRAEAEGTLAHAELIARAAPVLDDNVKITSSQIRNLADRGRIAQHGADTAARPLYRIGEVLAVVRDIRARKDARAQVLARRARQRDERETGNPVTERAEGVPEGIIAGAA
jgi:hypothetical protein